MARSSFGALVAAEEFDISCGDFRGAPRGVNGRCFSKNKRKTETARKVKVGGGRFILPPAYFGLQAEKKKNKMRESKIMKENEKENSALRE